MSTPDNNPFRQIGFFTLAGVATAELADEQVIAVQNSPLTEFRGAKVGCACAHFANWPMDPRAVRGFTRKFGGLRAPLKPGQEFSFFVSEWVKDQQRLRATWDQALYRFEKFGLRNQSQIEQRTIRTEEGEEFVSRSGMLEFRANSLFRYLWLEFASTPLERLRKCRHESCPTPYFIATHLGQRYCSEVCAHWGQSKWKRIWWKSHGSDWRQKRSKQKTGRKMGQPRGAK